jgi:hypothetical protein
LLICTIIIKFRIDFTDIFFKFKGINLKKVFDQGGRSMKKTVLFSLIVLLPLLVFGQYRTKPGVDFRSLLQAPATIGRAATNLLGLDPSRLQMHQSYQMNFMNFGGQSMSQGLYLNTISYQFSLPLSVSVQWGMAHQPFASSFQNASMFKSGPFLSAAQVRYQPKPNMLLQLDFRQGPYSYDSYGYYDSPWSRW